MLAYHLHGFKLTTKMVILCLICGLLMSCFSPMCFLSKAEKNSVITIFKNEKGDLIKEGESREWSFYIPFTGEYELKANYVAVGGKGITPQVGLSFNSPYNTKDGIVLDMPRIWENDLKSDRFLQDDLGNERLPAQTEVEEWQTMTLLVTNSDNELALDKGDHTLFLFMLRQSVKIMKLTIVPKLSRPTYGNYIKQQDGIGAKNSQGIENFYEAELTWQKSHPEIVVS